MRKKAPVAKDAGFTLTELLVVLVILGLIAAAITPQVMGRLDRSRLQSATLQLESLAASLDLYKIDTGRYPSESDGLSALMVPPESSNSWAGPYIRSQRNVIDPWGNDIVYQPVNAGERFQLTILGADGAPGGEELSADIVYPDIPFAQQ